MLRKILARFSAQSDRDTLAAILADDDNREFFLGAKEIKPPTDKDIERDIRRLVRYSESADYAVFAKVAWADVTRHMDRLTNERTTADEAAFSRGALAATLKILRESYNARTMLRMADESRKTA